MTFGKKTAVLILTAIGLYSASLRAETHTNLIYNVSIALHVAQQDFIPLSTNQFVLVVHNSSFGSANISDALANTPLFKTNHLQGAKLLFRVADFGSTNNQHPSFILRKGTNDFDMGSYFNFSFPALSVTSKVPGPNGTTNATDYTTFGVSLAGTSPGYFDVQGFCIVKNSSVFNGRNLIQTEEFPATITASLAGTGATGGKKALFKGTVLISKRRVEIKDY